MHRLLQIYRLISNTLCMDCPMLIGIRKHDKLLALQTAPLEMSMNIYQRWLNAEKLRVSHDNVEGTVQNGTMLANNLQEVGM